MGISYESEEKQVAKVLCKGNCKSAKDKYKYEGIQDCRSASMLNSGPKDCRFGCLGFGTCKAVSYTHLDVYKRQRSFICVR